jgi:hypothetical protein
VTYPQIATRAEEATDLARDVVVIDVKWLVGRAAYRTFTAMECDHGFVFSWPKSVMPSTIKYLVV